MKRFKVTVSMLFLAVGLFALLGVSDCENNSKENQEFEKKKATVENLMTTQPGPEIRFSMDRYLLTERLKRFNDTTKMTYLYVVMNDGTWLKVTIIGKLASTSKRLTSPQQEYWVHGNNNGLGAAPDEMGVYGESVGAHLGMTTIGSLIEFGGFISYIYSEVPLNFSGKQMVEISVNADPQQKAALLKGLEAVRGKK